MVQYQEVSVLPCCVPHCPEGNDTPRGSREMRREGVASFDWSSYMWSIIVAASYTNIIIRL